MRQNKEKTHVREVLRYFIPEAWRSCKSYFVCCGANTILTIIAPFISIFMMPLIINELCGERSIVRLLIYAAVLVGGERLVQMGISALDITREKYSDRFENFFTEKLSRRTMELDFQLTEDKNALDLLQRAREGMTWYSGGLTGILQPFFLIVVNAAVIAGVVALIIVNAPILLPITAAVLVLSALANKKINNIDIENFKKLSKVNRIFGYLGWDITDFHYGKDIRLYNAKDMMVQKWDGYTRESCDMWTDTANRRLPFQFIMVFGRVLRDFLSYLILGILVIAGKMTLGVFSQMLTSVSTFSSCMEQLLQNAQDLVKRSSYAYEYVEFMRYPAVVQSGTRHVSEGAHTVEFRNVCFTYPHTDVKVLDGVNITLNQGEHLSIVGLNGAGKTTFIKLLCRLYDPTDGEILLDGVYIKEYETGEYMRLFAPVFQDFRLFAFSIRDNIAVSGSISDEELNGLLEKVGLADKVNSLEKGADTMLFKPFDENGIEPSGGEQQKLAIARALHKKAPLVILDEPTAALDPVAEYEIYRQFNDLVGNKTAIYISHRLSSCKFCDRIAVFAEGRIKEYGTHEELCEKPNGIYAEMFAAQAQYYN